jgi:hypothetical protein
MLNIENIDPNYIFIPLLFISTFTYFLYSSNYSGEDEYQNSRSKEGIKPYVFCTTYIDNENKYENIKYKIDGIIKKSIIEYYKYNDNMKNYIMERYKIEEETGQQLTMNNEQLWENIYKNELLELKITFNDEQRRFSFAFDHRYFGGLYFLKLFGSMIEFKPINVYKESYMPVMSEISILKMLYFWITKKSNNKLRMKNDIDRLVFSYNYTNDINEKKVRRQTVVFYNILKKIFNGIERTDKDFLRVMITAAYESTRKTFNNVGILFIDFYRDMTIEQLEKMLLNNKYQAHATNLIQQYINNGKYVRNDIDIVLTSGFLYSELNENNSYIKSSYTTYLSIAHYPIYIVSITVGETSYVTITNMSEDVNIEKIKQNLNENMYNIKSSFF